MTQGCHPKYINYADKSIEKNYNQNQTGKKKKEIHKENNGNI